MTAQRQRVAVITGASSGIGKAAAQALLAQGWHVIGIGRNPARTAMAEADLRASSKTGRFDMVRANLALMTDVARAAHDVAQLTDRIDVLINNAGGMAQKKVVTAEGNEENFASNHLGPFLLTSTLLPLLKRAVADSPPGGVRILNTSSDAGEMIPGLDWNDLQTLESFESGVAYCRAKLANVLHVRGLAKRLAGDGIVAHAMHPGMVDSNFINGADEGIQAYMRSISASALTPEQGADTLVWLATADEPGRSTGGYFFQRQPREPNPLANDDAYVERLWAETERLVAVEAS